MAKTEGEALVRKALDELARFLSEADAPRVWGQRLGAEEIRWVTITPDIAEANAYELEIETAREVRRFGGAKETTRKDPQSLGFAEKTPRAQPSLPLFSHWAHRPRGLRAFAAERLGTHGIRRGAALEDKRQLPVREVIEKLKSGKLSEEEKRKLIIEAEALEFDGEQAQELNSLLRSFIEQYRDSNKPDDLVAVASAIRKYVATMRMEDLASVAMLLDVGHNGAVPLEVELELAKMLVRKLIANPPERADAEPELADHLMDMARTYLSPRMLSRDKYGAVAVNAVFALLLLRSRHAEDLVGILAKLDIPWFTQLVARRALRVRQAFGGGFSREQCERYLQCFDALDRQVAAHRA